MSKEGKWLRKCGAMEFVAVEEKANEDSCVLISCFPASGAQRQEQKEEGREGGGGAARELRAKRRTGGAG